MKTKIRAGTGLVMLFGSRASGVLVAILFVPLYAKLLNANDFGLATLVLSGQALALAFDLGMSALIARDAAAHSEHSTPAAQLRQAEVLLTGIYLVALPVSIGVFIFYRWPIWQIVACMSMYLALTIQNLNLNYMLGKSMHAYVALSQSIGVISRALFCAAALLVVSPKLETFILSQVVGAIAHMALTRRLCITMKRRPADLPEKSRPVKFSATPLFILAKRGLPLFIVGMVGAITINVDKPIVAYFFGAENLAPYFLATTFSLTPIGLLAGPVAQYFQPKVVRAYLSKDAEALTSSTTQLIISLAIVVVFPTLIIWIFRAEIIHIWLGQEKFVQEVSRLSSWLLPAAAIGAIGNLPLSIVMAAGDYSFQAKLSIALAAFVLAAVTIASAVGSLVHVCIAYLGYYFLASAALWWRSMQFEASKRVARLSAIHTLVGVLLLGVSIYAFSLLAIKA